jgi:tetratricopeptide (TPR) repeat protein
MPVQAPMPAPVPMTPMAPIAPIPPMPPIPAIAPDVAIQMAQDAMDAVGPVLVDVDVQIADVKAKLDDMNFDFQYSKDWTDVQQKAMEKAQEAIAKSNEKMAQAYAKAATKYNYNFDVNVNKGLAMQQQRVIFPGPRGSDDSMYNNGLRAIDDHQYEQALAEFNNVVARNGARAPGALYWKAYVLNKLGRAADAQAAIDALRKTYPNSSWIEDAKPLELDVKQSKGPVSPESETDDDIKVLALNGLMQSDPEKALPQVENLLKGAHSPKLKRQALFVIAQNNTPQAQKMLEQIARGGNPDLQVRAIQFMSEKRNPDTPKILLEIYTSTSDPAVKRAVLNTFQNNRDKERLLEVLKSEKDAGLREQAINRLGDVDGQPELWQIYQSETTPEGKMAVLNAMHNNGNLDKLAEVARTDKDPKVRQKAIEAIASQDGGNPMATLVSLYSSEQDEKVKQTIIDHLSGRRGDCKPLVDVAKSEKDLKLKVRLVERLSNMTRTCQAANDYLVEILSNK